MDSSLPTHQVDRVIFPVPLGPASNFNRAIFPLYRRTDPLGLGDLYLDATLDEVLKIPQIGVNPQLRQAIVATTKARYDLLSREKEELEQLPKSNNPFKRWKNYRAARLFLHASKSLYFATKSRSEDIIRSNKRSLLSIPAEDGQPSNDDASPDENLQGISVIVERPLDDNTTQQLLDVADTLASCSGQLGSDDSTSETSTFLTDEYVLASESFASLVNDAMEEALTNTTEAEPSSPTITQNIQNNFVIYALHSTLNGTTSHFGGNQNSGGVTHIITRRSDV